MGGVHADDCKELTADRPIRAMDPPEQVTIPLSQHIGTPCAPLVKKDDRVLVGQIIGDAEDRLTAPVHSSVSGYCPGRDYDRGSRWPQGAGCQYCQ